MTFTELCEILYPFFKARCKSKADFFDLLILNSIGSNGGAVSQNIAKMSGKQKRNLCNGMYSISKIAIEIYPVLDTSALVDILNATIQGDSIDEFIEAFSGYISNMTKGNFAQKLADEFKEIILDNSAMFRSAQLQGTAIRRSQLFQEDDGLCPCCGKKLSLDTAAKNAILAVKIDEFDHDTGKPYKMIGLCVDCAKLDKLGKLDKDLVAIKGNLERKAKLHEQAGSVSVDEKLMEAIERLLKSPKSSKIDLSMKSLKINQKIDMQKELVFYNKIKGNVASYFPLLYKMFGELDGDDKRSYELLSSTIKTSFLIAEKKSQNKEDIFNLLVDQVSSAGNCDKSIAEIIVSYFVQSCEVFHEIPKQG